MATPPAFQRVDGRGFDQLRNIRLDAGVAPHAAGSVRITMGGTQVICAVTVQDEIPRWMKKQNIAGGWLTAEYSLLPYATGERTPREAASGKLGGRTQEIQRLIGRALRAAVDLSRVDGLTLWVDCDVLQADGGTRTAAITGGWVALRLALNRLLAEKRIREDPMREGIAAVSVGKFGSEACLDLSYQEDSVADVDMNVIMTASGRYIEIQGAAERGFFSPEDLARMLDLARSGISALVRIQSEALDHAGSASLR